MAKPNWDNRTLFQGDNLDVMRAMNSESVDLIATDPPFNKGHDFHATPDSLAAGSSFQDRWTWEEVHEEWLEQIQGDSLKLTAVVNSARKAHSDGMGAFLCFLSVRLMAMHRLLKPTGSIFIHCDHSAGHYIKSAMDAVFGSDNFVNEIVWRRAEAKGRAKRSFGKNHDIIFWYGKSRSRIFNPIYRQHDARYLSKYRHVEEGTMRRYQLDNLISPKPNPKTRYEFLGVTKDWRWTKERMEQGFKDGIVVQTKPGATARLKRYLDEQGGPMIDSMWDDVKALNSQANERTGYPTQKPIVLYKRIIKVASNPGDIVLDPFAGCATTCVAAEMEQRQWVGIDIWNKIEEVIKSRLEQERELKDLDPNEIFLIRNLPERTDKGDVAAHYLRVRETTKNPCDRDKFKNNKERKEFLIKRDGIRCAGCDRIFDRPEYLELDHNTPRSSGGWDHISNYVLLCRPCNGAKSNTLTLEGLRKRNKQEGFMASQPASTSPHLP